ncbi:MAG: hypothetical protein QW753_02625 [Thermofilum sp.]|uniref:V-type ATP synthase subunit C n=1 Tax=Thermofilum pendens TaxID=2269 RepID=A0A7C4H7M6_THEPE
MEVYTAVRAHGLKARLLTKQDYEALLKGARKLWDFPDYSQVSEKDPIEMKLEKVYAVYVRRMNLLAKSTPTLFDFIRALLDRLEVENIKIQIRYILGFQRPVIYYPYGHFLGPAKLKSLHSESSLWRELSNSPFKLPEDFSFRTQLPAEREVLVDMLYLRYLSDEIRGLKMTRDARSALEDLLSLEYTLRYVLWEKALGGSTTKEMLKAVELPFQLLEGFLTELRARSVSDVIVHGMREVLRKARAEALKYPLGAVYIYIFNILALVEAQNIEKILLGQELGLAEEVINRHLYL